MAFSKKAIGNIMIGITPYNRMTFNTMVIKDNQAPEHSALDKQNGIMQQDNMRHDIRLKTYSNMTISRMALSKKAIGSIMIAITVHYRITFSTMIIKH